MKVLQINSVCGIGSTGRIATDIDRILKDKGYDSYIAFGRGLPKGCDTAIRIGNNMDNYAHVAATRLFDSHGFASVKATNEFIDKLEELNPDVIHLHNIHGYYINMKILFDYLKRADKPVVWTFHDCWPFTGHCAYFDYVGCDKWKKGCHSCPQKREYPSSLLIDNSRRNYTSKKEIFTGIKNLTIVTPSRWLAELVKESYLSEYPVKVINNGIDLSLFKPTEGDFRKKYNLEDKFIILGVASVWDRRKGLNYFIRLSEQLREDEAIVVVGLTDKQKNSLPKNIIGITRTNNVKELAEIYSTSDVFVNPTLEDNFPTTNLEALACGTPVITFKTGGSPESIDTDCGLIVEKGDYENLRSSINEIKSKGISKESCIKRASQFDMNSRFEEYVDLYLRIINN